MNGTSIQPRLFSPHMPVTRAMVVTVLYLADGSPDVNGLTNPFTDVAPGRWYTNAVIWAADRGIIKGVSNNRFAPHNEITRQDLATILNRYANYAGIELPVTRAYTAFNDDTDIRSYAREAIERFYMAGIINGRPGNIFDPTGTASRGELAAILMSLLN